MTDKSSERRKFPRIKTNMPFNVDPAKLGGLKTIEISLGGLSARSERLYDGGQKIRLKLNIPDRQPVYCEAKVVWILPRTRSASVYRMGLQFINMESADAEKIKHFLDAEAGSVS